MRSSYLRFIVRRNIYYIIFIISIRSSDCLVYVNLRLCDFKKIVIPQEWLPLQSKPVGAVVAVPVEFLPGYGFVLKHVTDG